MTEKREKRTGSGIMIAIYGTYRELEAWKKLERQKIPAATETIAKLTEKINQQLIDYLLERKDGTIREGRVELWAYKKPPLVERLHAFSRNKVNFLFPSPIQNEPPFTVRTRLSDLRRTDEVNSSLDAYKLLGIGERSLPEQQEDFVSRTVDELVSVESARNKARASEPGSPLIAHLRNLAEYLVAGRLLALNQLEPVPRLGLAIARNGDRISARIKFNGTVVTQNYPAQLFHRPVENTEAFIKAGVLFRDEVA